MNPIFGCGVAWWDTRTNGLHFREAPNAVSGVERAERILARRSLPDAPEAAMLMSRLVGPLATNDSRHWGSRDHRSGRLAFS